MGSFDKKKSKSDSRVGQSHNKHKSKHRESKNHQSNGHEMTTNDSYDRFLTAEEEEKIQQVIEKVLLERYECIEGLWGFGFIREQKRKQGGEEMQEEGEEKEGEEGDVISFRNGDGVKLFRKSRRFLRASFYPPSATESPAEKKKTKERNSGAVLDSDSSSDSEEKDSRLKMLKAAAVSESDVVNGLW
eukprot:Nk52_evm67s158 gene=Nk52_evmTU67s158